MGMRKPAQEIVEARFGMPAKNLVHRLYYEEGLSVRAIAKKLGVAVGTITNWMEDWNFPARRLMVPKIPKLKDEEG